MNKQQHNNKETATKWQHIIERAYQLKKGGRRPPFNMTRQASMTKQQQNDNTE